MTLPHLQRRAAEALLGAFCEKRVPAHARPQLRLEYLIRGNSAEIIERRVPWKDPHDECTSSPVAKFTFSEKSRLWTLKWLDRNSRWHQFDPYVQSPRLGELLATVDKDTTAIFWG